VPGIVAVHHLPGWDEFYREFCERLARHGYSVICPDLYDRFGHGTPDDVAAKVRADAASPTTAWWPTARPRSAG
jgi:carboxymethylenebutenolidase